MSGSQNDRFRSHRFSSSLKADRLVCEDERIGARMRERKFVDVSTLLRIELNSPVTDVSALRTEVKETIGSSKSTNERLKRSAHHIVQHVEKGQKVAFSCTVCPDENCKPVQFETGECGDGGEAIDADALQGNHNSSLAAPPIERTTSSSR